MAKDTTTLKRLEEFFRSPEESKLIEEAQKEILTESESSVLDQDQLREQEDWNYLANKVVGAEGN